MGERLARWWYPMVCRVLGHVWRRWPSTPHGHQCLRCDEWMPDTKQLFPAPKISGPAAHEQVWFDDELEMKLLHGESPLED